MLTGEWFPLQDVHMTWSGIWFVFLMLFAPQGEDEPVFLAQRLDGPTAWYGPFSEGSAVFDVDNDGTLDITAGPYWYRGPDFQRRPLRDCPTYGVEFVNNLGEFAYDLNRDGWTDLISASWFENGIYWYENSGGRRQLWARRKIADSEATEALIFEDVSGDGVPDILPNHYRPQEIFWIEVLPGPSPEFRRHVIGRQGSRHGLGFGDVDGDGRKDVITMDGWHRAPQDPRSQPWQWRGEWNNPGLGGIQMLAHDVNGDGLNDVVYGMGHDYGLFWLEQHLDGDRRSWTRHTVHTRWSQAHTLRLFDVDGDGRLDLLTGKRIRGHGESDPGSLDPMGVYWYHMSADGFVEHVIAYNSQVGTGMNINTADLDADGDFDLIVSGKSGLYLLENMRTFRKTTLEILQRY